MKKLALVLGSLLVVGSVASAKEVMPAPTPAPEVMVKVVEKPVIVYKDRVVKDTKWHPNGFVSVGFKTMGEIESTKTTDDRSWVGADPKSRLELKGKVALTEKQALEIRTRDWRGLTHRNNKEIDRNDAYVKHTYNFGKVDKMGVELASKYKYKGSNKHSINEKLSFDFSDYFFQNDYIKTTSAVIAPNVTYAWTRSNDHTEDYALYLDYEAELMYGFGFHAEFDNFYNYSKANTSKKANQTGDAEFTLSKGFDLYENGKHSVGANIDAVYTTKWLWSKTKDDGTKAEKRWNEYEAKLEPTLTYTFKPTEFVKLHATLGAEYVNRNTDRKTANHWRWQPYSELGMKVVF